MRDYWWKVTDQERGDGQARMEDLLTHRFRARVTDQDRDGGQAREED